MRNNPVDTGNNSRCRARTTAIKHANRDDGNTWCHSVITATNCSGNVRAVAVAVFSAVAVAHRRVTPNDSATEFGVRTEHASIDDICGDAASGGGTADCSVQRQRALIDAVEAPE